MKLRLANSPINFQCCCNSSGAPTRAVTITLRIHWRISKARWWRGAGRGGGGLGRQRVKTSGMFIVSPVSHWFWSHLDFLERNIASYCCEGNSKPCCLWRCSLGSDKAWATPRLVSLGVCFNFFPTSMPDQFTSEPYPHSPNFFGINNKSPPSSKDNDTTSP